MLLHASEISFFHPVLQAETAIKAPFGGEFERMYHELGFNSMLE